MTQATASPITASFKPRASPHRNSSRLRQMTSQLRPNTCTSGARLTSGGATRQAIGRPGCHAPGRARSELSEFDWEPGRRRFELDTKMFSERRLVVVEPQSGHVLMERRV